MNRKNTLMVDDSATMRQLMPLTLKMVRGCQVVEACQGKEAADKPSRHPFDPVITDNNMTAMDGLVLMGHFRDVGRQAFAPIIIVTSKGEERARDQGLQ